MSLIRGEEAREWLEQGGSLECPECSAQFTVESLGELTQATGDPWCAVCQCAGFIPRRARTTVMDRFPSSFSGRFTPVPDELLDHADSLGLRPHSLLLVIALSRHRWRNGQRVFPSIAFLATTTGMGEATVKRHLDHLENAGLITRGKRRNKRGGWSTNEYDIEPLWGALDQIVRGNRGSE